MRSSAVCRKLRGIYSVVMMIDGIIYAFRDPLGIKPFCIAKTENGYMVASESVAADALNAKFLRDVFPGELIRIDSEGIKCTRIAVPGKRAHCIFEYIYFARADSIIDGVLVYDVRRKIGQKLYEEDPVGRILSARSLIPELPMPLDMQKVLKSRLSSP